MSQISPLFFSPEKELFSWCLLKKTPRRTKILITPVWNKILKIWDTLFELIQIDVQCSKYYFKIFLPQEAGAFGNNIEKEPQKLRPNLKKFIFRLTSNGNDHWVYFSFTSLFSFRTPKYLSIKVFKSTFSHLA